MVVVVVVVVVVVAAAVATKSGNLFITTRVREVKEKATVCNGNRKIVHSKNLEILFHSRNETRKESVIVPAVRINLEKRDEKKK